MDTRLLRHYEAELSFMREMGGEFAEAFPKIAGRLGMEGLEVIDPYVERLLEGVAFLNARVQLELELQFPAFTTHLLDIVYPQILGPVPSMMIAELVPDHDNGALASGYTLPRGTALRSRLLEGTQTACIFRTARDTTLWPVEIAAAEYIAGRGDLVAAGAAVADGRAGIRIRLRRSGDQPLAALPLDRLTLFLGGQGVPGHRLYELLCTRTVTIAARGASGVVPLAARVAPVGFAAEEALLPTPPRAFDGYRLLQEYFALPHRFHFVEIAGLAPALAAADGAEFDLYLLLREGDPALAGLAADDFRLHCVPAANLFERRCDRVPVTVTDVEQHVVVDRTAPLDYEVHTILGVEGIGGDGEAPATFRPFYDANEFTATSGGGRAFYSVARRMRQRSERERLKGSRNNYLGSEAYLSLVDAQQAPFPAGLRQLAVRALVTNRDLPLLLSTGTPDLFHLPEGGPVASIRTPIPPTRPQPSLAQGEAAWRLISHLSLNYLSLAGGGPDGGAAAIREIVGTHAPPNDRGVARLLGGITGVTSRPIVRRVSDEVLSTAVRGLEITVQCDEDFFEGAGAYTLVAVLERFFRSYATINSFTETVLRTQQRGEVARWLPEKGLVRMI